MFLIKQMTFFGHGKSYLPMSVMIMQNQGPLKFAVTHNHGSTVIHN